MTISSYENLSHSKWDGKYQVVLIPKGRKKALYGKIRAFLGPVLRELAGTAGCALHIASLETFCARSPLKRVTLVAGRNPCRAGQGVPEEC